MNSTIKNKMFEDLCVTLYKTNISIVDKLREPYFDYLSEVDCLDNELESDALKWIIMKQRRPVNIHGMPYFCWYNVRQMERNNFEPDGALLKVFFEPVILNSNRICLLYYRTVMNCYLFIIHTWRIITPAQRKNCWTWEIPS